MKAMQRVSLVVCLLLVPAFDVYGQIVPEREFAGVNRSIVVRIDAPADSQGPFELRLLEPLSWRSVERAEVAPGSLDLADVFPVLWTSTEPRMLYVQLSAAGRGIGAPVVLRPLVTPSRSRDGLTAQLRDAFLATDASTALQALGSLARTQREALSAEVRVTPAGRAVLSGYRVFAERRVRLETSEGVIEWALRPDAAPNTCAHVERLVDGGFYDGVIFHRVVGTPPGAPASMKGYLIQSGDPTGTGEGGAGVMIDFEPSVIQHDLGIVSMARREDDPNSASSQFIICLDRETCAPLDGRSVAFAEVVSGLDVVKAIAATPVGPRVAEDPLSPRDRPLTPPRIERAVMVPAPPAGSRMPDVERPPPVTR